MRVVDLVVDAVADTSEAMVTVDVGVVSAVVFGMVELPAPLIDDLIRHALDVTARAGIVISAVCFVRAGDDVLRRRAASDARSRRALDDNLRLAPDIERIVRAVHSSAPANVLELSTEDEVDIADLSVWVTDRAADRTDLLAILAELHARGGSWNIG